jgi:type VI secretion system protein ImpF
MSRIPLDKPLVPSVLDRLLDDDPSAKKETPKSRTQVLRELKQSVRRDLENLLNTRPRATMPPPPLEELEQSLVSYGLPDISRADMGSTQRREEFRQTMENVIRRLEPRLKAVSVTLLDEPNEVERTLHFRIDAMLRVDPAPEPVIYDSRYEPATGNVEVKG